MDRRQKTIRNNKSKIYTRKNSHISSKLEKNISKKETIMSNIGDPFLTEDMLAPLKVTLTSDKPRENGGLSYDTKYTNYLNVKMVHDYYKDYLNMELPSDTKIVFGSAASMMIPAYYYALQKKENKSVTVNTNLDIFYYPHKLATYISKNVEWVNNNIKSDLTVIASPSNPLGALSSPKNIKSKYMLFDVVYDVYLFTGSYKTVNPELYEEFKKNKNISIVFSFSKLGIAGVRFGFLLTRDDKIAKYAEEYIKIISVNYSSSSATIARLAYYNFFRSKSRNEIIYNKLKYRRDFFLKHAEKHGIKILNTTHMVPYIYTNKSVEWWLKMFNVNTASGIDFGDSNKNSRIHLLMSENYWNEFERRFLK